MPANSGCGRIVLPMAGGGRGRGHRYIVAGAGLRFLYPRGFYPLPFLLLSSTISQEEDRGLAPLCGL